MIGHIRVLFFCRACFPCVCVFASSFLFFFQPHLLSSLLFFPPSSYLGVCFTCEHSVFLLAPVFLSDERVGRFQRATQLVWRNFSTYTFIWRRRPLICRLPPERMLTNRPPHLLSSEGGGSLKVQVSVFSTKWEHASASARIPPAYMRCTCARACTRCTQTPVSRANTLEHCFM